MFQFNISYQGWHLLTVRYFIGTEHRPCKLLINGDQIYDEHFGERSGANDWSTEKIERIWIKDFKKGKNVMEIKRNGAIPHLSTIKIQYKPEGPQ